MDGISAITRIDNEIDFDWGLGLVTNDVADFVSIRWFGKILAPATEEFTLLFMVMMVPILIESKHRTSWVMVITPIDKPGKPLRSPKM